MSDFTFLVAPNSSSPIPNPPQTSGDFTGGADGAINGHATGTFTPAIPFAGGTGAKLSVIGWGNGQFWVVLYGTRPQNYFTSVGLGAPASLTFLSASALSYSNTIIPGYTAWSWTDGNEFTYQGLTLAATFSGLSPLIPTPSGKGDITTPNAWETVSTGKLPPSEYDGIPGGGFV